MKRLICALLVGMIATQAQALSCLRPNLATAFNQFQKSDETYRIAVGTIRITGKPAKYIDGKPRRMKATFQGQFMGLSGLGAMQKESVTLQTHCLAHWCGGFPNNTDTKYVMFLRKSTAGNVLDLTACPDGNMSTVTDKRLKMLQKCLKRGLCSNSAIKAMEKF